ncbi:hypothetical protein [Rhizobium sp.]
MSNRAHNLADETQAQAEAQARMQALDAEVPAFMEVFTSLAIPSLIQKAAHEFLGKFPPERRLGMASALSWANPFYLPEMSDEVVKSLSVNANMIAELTMRAKLTASRAPQLNVLLACAPKSASTFIAGALQTALGLPSAALFASTPRIRAVSQMGGNLREQEPEELALIRNGLNGAGYVAQHHSRCTPYLSLMLKTYNVRPIVTHRNLFDTFVSLDDMIMGYRSDNVSEGLYFSDGLPANYGKLEQEDRLTILVQRNTAWFIQFYVSWKKCERAGLVKPLWVSYEKDFLADKQGLAERVIKHLGLDPDSAAKLLVAFEDKTDGAAKRLNKGVAGRGRAMPDSVRAIIERTAHYYRDEEDLSPLLNG